MSSPYKLSLSSAIMINMNIMLGAGIFLNPVVLSLYAGALSPISYLVVGLLILPLILSLTYLLRRVPGGSFYDFGSQINQLTGFIAAWSYFLGKLSSGALMLHFGFSLLQELIPWMQNFNILTIDFIGIIGFTLLNLLGLKTGKYIQLLFMILKVIPIVAIVGIGFFSFNPANFTPSNMDIKGLYITIPLVLYAFTGFEASCSLYRLMANPEKNAARAVILSFLGVLSMTMLFQAAFYAAVNPDLLMFTPYFDGLSLFLYSTIWAFPAKNIIVWLLQSSVALSALGGSYGILFSVNWNLYILAKDKLTIFSNTFSKLNRYHIAWMCVLAEALLYFIYLFSTNGYQIPLQQLAALGCTVAYAISTLALLFVRIRQQKTGGMITVVAVLGTICCAILLLTTINSIFKYSLAPLTGYLALLSVGILMFGYQRRKNTKSLT
ncbi:APC family permease [bacterium]|jgi:amino acid transporter|nr:APC family permease [bacterium]MBT5014901.1 APC family permease [bacterium]